MQSILEQLKEWLTKEIESEINFSEPDWPVRMETLEDVQAKIAELESDEEN